jgi:hypothetical protein
VTIQECWYSQKLMRCWDGLFDPARRRCSARARSGSGISAAGSTGAPGTSKSGLRVSSSVCSGSVVVPAGWVVVAGGSVVVGEVSVVVAPVSVSVVSVVSDVVGIWSRAQSLTSTTRVPL